jgi:hypothetical protein
MINGYEAAGGMRTARGNRQTVGVLPASSFMLVVYGNQPLMSVKR